MASGARGDGVMWGPLREAMAAAEYTMLEAERRIDARIGRPAREAVERYGGIAIVGVPIAWVVPGLQWTHASTYGLIAGLVLYGAIDIARVRRRGDGDAPR